MAKKSKRVSVKDECSNSPQSPATKRRKRDTSLSLSGSNSEGTTSVVHRQQRCKANIDSPFHKETPVRAEKTTLLSKEAGLSTITGIEQGPSAAPFQNAHDFVVHNAIFGVSTKDHSDAEGKLNLPLSRDH